MMGLAHCRGKLHACKIIPGRTQCCVYLSISLVPGTSSSSWQHNKTNGHLSSTPHNSSSSSSKPPNSSSISRLPAGPPIRHSKLVQSRGTHHANGPSSSSSGAGGGSSSSKQQPPPGSALIGAGPLGDAGDDTRGWGDGDVSYEAIMQQHMRQQDEALDHISIHVDRIKQTGQLMHEELEEQVSRHPR